MPRDEEFKGHLVASGQEPLEELALRHPHERPRAEELLDVPEDGFVLPALHARGSCE